MHYGCLFLIVPSICNSIKAKCAKMLFKVIGQQWVGVFWVGFFFRSHYSSAPQLGWSCLIGSG